MERAYRASCPPCQDQLDRASQSNLLASLLFTDLGKKTVSHDAIQNFKLQGSHDGRQSVESGTCVVQVLGRRCRETEGGDKLMLGMWVALLCP